MTTNNNQPAQAMLASLSIHLPRQSRLNKTKSAEIEDANHAQRGTSTLSVHYFRQSNMVPKINGKGEPVYKNGKQVFKEEVVDALGPLKTFQGDWRRAHKRLTRIFSEKGPRLLLPIRAEEYMAMTQRFEAQWPELRDNFLKIQPDWEVTAHERMGTLSPGDFPSLQECTEDLYYSIVVLPCAAEDQWAKVLKDMPHLAEQMQVKEQEFWARAKQEIRKETWGDLIKPLQRMTEVLSKDRSKIYETLLGSMHDILELAPGYNMTNDVDMDTFIKRAKDDLAGVTTEDLRNDPEIRKLTYQKAANLLNDFSEYARKFAREEDDADE